MTLIRSNFLSTPSYIRSLDSAKESKVGPLSTWHKGISQVVPTGPAEASDWIPTHVKMPSDQETTSGSHALSQRADTLGGRRIVSPPVRKPKEPTKLSKNRLKLLQHWECVVSELQDGIVCCEMYDLVSPDNPVEYAEVYIDEFNLFDRPLLAEGTVFYWSLGHVQMENGIIRGYSEIRLRRVPPITKSVQTDISRKVESLSALLSGN